MYTFNNFVYGHRMADDKRLNNELDSYGLEFSSNGFEVSTPYHGGKLPGDTYPVIFGKVITDDDNNEFFIDEVRLAKESDYEDDYRKFLSEFKNSLNEDRGEEKKYDEFIDRLIKFLDDNDPMFYTVEASS